MFKKTVDTRAQSRLSGADRKKLRRAIKERFPHASDDDVDLLLPPKMEITVSRLQNRIVLYIPEGGSPMFFDIDGRGADIFPTVFALWLVPELLPAFMLKAGEVSRFIIGGADLMFPGVLVPPEGLPVFVAGQPWAVKVPGNPVPFAVGMTTMSNKEALVCGLRGKALRVLHCYRDTLWDSVQGHHVPNSGFFEDAVFEDPAFSSASQIEDTADVASVSEGSVPGLHHVTDVELNEVAHNVEKFDDSAFTNNNDAGSKEISKDLKNLKVDNVCQQQTVDKEESIPSPEEMDALLDKCLLQALHATVKEKDMPMSGSTLWSGHVLSCRPQGVMLDVKRSSYKKLAKWLQTKSATGLITAKEDRHKKEVLVVSVNKNHPEYTSFRPEKRMLHVHTPADHSSSEGQLSAHKLEVSEVYKSTSHVNPILNAVCVDPTKYYTASEASSIVFKYVEKENLVKPTNKAVVILDALLCDALYKGSIKKGSTYPTEIHKKDLGSTFLARMQVHHYVIRGAETVLRKGAIRNIQIVTERRQGNKKVTKVSGMESFLVDAETLASELQKKFACSTSVSEVPGKKGQHEVLIQGGVIEDLARRLVEQYDIPKRYIEVMDKTHK